MGPHLIERSRDADMESVSKLSTKIFNLDAGAGWGWDLESGREKGIKRRGIGSSLTQQASSSPFLLGK